MSRRLLAKAAVLSGLLLVLIPSFLHAFLVDGFDAPKTNLVKKRGDFVGGGKPKSRVPFVNSRLVQDSVRGPVLEINFNVSEGYGGTFSILHDNKIPPDFNVVQFWVRGVPSAFKVELKDDHIHSFVVEKQDRSNWRLVTIPLPAFSNSEKINRSKTNEFVFVFEDHRTSPRLGTIYVDDLEFVKDKEQEVSVGDLPIPGPVLANGEIAVGQSIHTEELAALKLSVRLPQKGVFHALRFEATWDNAHWFYLAESTDPDLRQFEFNWSIADLPSGTYGLRAVVTDALGNRKEGKSGQIKIQNYINFDKFLDQVEKSSFQYFMEEVDPRTYLVKDRAREDTVYSVGLSGFQITVYVIGVERGWIAREEAVRRISVALDFIYYHTKSYHGLVPHWLGMDREEIWEKGTGDAVETSYLLAGAIVASEYFDRDDPQEKALREKSGRLYDRVAWDELLKRQKPEDDLGLLPWHWSEKGGASKLEIRGYNEAMLPYFLALGAPQRAISERSWKAYAATYQRGKYSQYELIACAPLFTHQYTHLWVDFRGIRDAHADYFENSILATLANREYSLAANQYPLEIWGLTASEGPNNYKAYGAPPAASSVPVINDGTIAPTAAATSIMFTPPLSIAAMRNMKDVYGDKLWGKYGFKDAFNPRLNWYAGDYLGLNQGPIVIAIENYRTGLIWHLFMKNQHVQDGLRKAGFHPNTAQADEEKPDDQPTEAPESVQ